MDVPWDDLVEGVGNADQGLLQIIVRKSKSPKKRPMRRPLNPLFNSIASHDALRRKEWIKNYYIYLALAVKQICIILI